jgi:hypothetical protein
MDMTEEDFPFCGLLAKSGLLGSVEVVRDFNEARDGDLERQYHFAFALMRAVVEDTAQLVPGFDHAVQQKTLRSCLAIIDEMADTGHDETAGKVAEAIRDRYIDWSYVEETPAPEIPAPEIPIARSPKIKTFSM